MILSGVEERMFAVYQSCRKAISGVWQGRVGHVDIDLRHSPPTLTFGALGGEIEIETCLGGGCQF